MWKPVATESMAQVVQANDGAVKQVIDVGRRFRHEYYGDVCIVFLMDKALQERFEQR